MIENVLVWNVRGLDTSQKRLKGLIKKWNISIVAIAEQFAGEDKLPKLAGFLGFQNFCSNEVVGGKVWLLW